MTEDEARAWFSARFRAPRLAKLDRFHEILVKENERQNLIAPSTISSIWTRHFLDSAQLLQYAPDIWKTWVDIGSGAGLPGLVIAVLSDEPVTLIEPRRLRADFLKHCRHILDLESVTVLQTKAEAAEVAPADVISARAVAKLDMLFSGSEHFATKSTTYLLPKGESAKTEVATARRSWQGAFHVEQSIVDPKSGIVVATGVARR